MADRRRVDGCVGYWVNPSIAMLGLLIFNEGGLTCQRTMMLPPLTAGIEVRQRCQDSPVSPGGHPCADLSRRPRGRPLTQPTVPLLYENLLQ